MRTWWIVAVVVPFVVACKKPSTEESAPSAKDYGAPIGVKVEGKPTFEVAFAVTKGRDPEPLLGPLVSALSKAVSSCPTLVEESKTLGITAVQFALDKGKAKVAPYKEPTAGTTCLVANLDGKELAKDSFPPLEARAEIRFPAAAPSDAAAAAASGSAQ
jgi:hypothetical protein